MSLWPSRFEITSIGTPALASYRWSTKHRPNMQNSTPGGELQMGNASGRPPGGETG
jgi:hypothetical protein